MHIAKDDNNTNIINSNDDIKSTLLQYLLKASKRRPPLLKA